MKRRLWSIILCLAMLVGMVSSVPVAYAAQTGTIAIKYFSDSSCTEPVTEVDIGKDFYAVMYIKDFPRFSGMFISMKYDQNLVELIPFGSDVLTTEAVRANGTITMAASTATSDSYGIKQDHLFTRSRDKNDPVYSKHYNVLVHSASPLLFTDEGWFAFSASPSNNSYPAITGEVGVMKMRFRAKGAGDAAFGPAQPKTEYEYDGYRLQDGNSILPYNDNTLPIKIKPVVSEAVELGKVEGVKVEGDKLVWNAVGNASSYKITVVHSENGSPIDSSTIKDINTNSIELSKLPSYDRGDVVVKVTAVGDGVNFKDGPASDDCPAKTYVQTLATPDVNWSGSSVVWDKVDGAYKYEVKVYENNQLKDTVYVDAADGKTSYEFVCTAYIKTPDVGENIYDVTVKALKDPADNYAKDSDFDNAGEKSVKGKVGAPTGPNLNENKVAAWVAPADLTNIGSYTINVYKYDEKVSTIKDISKNSTSYDLKSVIDQYGPGEYRFGIVATGIKDYADSAESKSSNELFWVSLGKVTEVQWSDKVVSWKDSQEGVDHYSVQIYTADGHACGSAFDVHKNQRTVDVSSVVVDAGKYYAEVVAVGDGTVHRNSEAEKSKIAEFKEALKEPENVLWATDAPTATWSAVEHALAYKVVLYIEGKPVVGGATTVQTPATSVDYSKFVKHPGKYTFTITALGDNENYSSSKTVESDDKNNVVPTKGTLNIKYYTDEELNVEATDVKVGDIVYATFVVDTDEPISTSTLPFNFDSKVLNVVDSQGNAVTSETAYDAFVVPALDFSLTENEVYPYVDNKEGFVKIQVGAGKEVQLAGATKLVAIRFKAIAADDAVISFADAKDDIYDQTAPSGAEFANNSGYIFLEPVSDTLAVSKTKLAVSKGKWNGNIAEWTAAEGASSYVVKLYKDGELKATVTTIENKYDFASEFKKSGKYEFTVTPVATEGSALYEDGDESEKSDVKEIIKKKLVASKPEWDGNTVTWDAVEGADEYIVKLYKDGELYDTVTTVKNSYRYSTELNRPGEYVVSVTPVANEDNGLYETGDESEKSDIKTIRDTGSSSSGGKKPSGGSGSIIVTLPSLIDIDGHWAEAEIENLAKLGYINGYEDGSFKPDWGITRAEFTKLLVTCLGLAGEYDDFEYEDTADHWAKNYIAVGTKYGVVNGIGDNLFDPDTIVTREQMSLMLYRIAGKPASPACGFADRLTGVSDWARDAVDYIADAGIMIGFEDNTFRGTESTTRAQAAVVLSRLFDAGFFSTYKVK